MTTDHHDPAPPHAVGPGSQSGTPDADVEGADRPASIPPDDRFAILKNWRRRAVLAHLDDEGGRATLGELAEVLGAAENGVSRRDLSSGERKRVYVGLYQCHLPRLDDAGVVEFDKRSGDVRLRPEADQLLPYVREDDETGETEADAATADRTVPAVGATTRAGLAWVTVALLGLAAVGAVGTPGTVAALAGVTALAGLETAAALRSDAEEL
jgi:DNA-binding transcriptional ArsR family regulator